MENYSAFDICIEIEKLIDYLKMMRNAISVEWMNETQVKYVRKEVEFMKEKVIYLQNDLIQSKNKIFEEKIKRKEKSKEKIMKIIKNEANIMANLPSGVTPTGDSSDDETIINDDIKKNPIYNPNNYYNSSDSKQDKINKLLKGIDNKYDFNGVKLSNPQRKRKNKILRAKIEDLRNEW